MKKLSVWGILLVLLTVQAIWAEGKTEPEKPAVMEGIEVTGTRVELSPLKTEVFMEDYNMAGQPTNILDILTYKDALEGIEEYSHIQILFWAHKVPEESRKLSKVHPMGLKEMPKKGIFATCSPARPNPVLLTAVKLVEINGNILKVQGLEAIDGTPVIDIKPYVKGYHGAESPKSPEWMEKIHAMLEEAD